jgi:outer membrane protein OmpA-like peptidoglycan-associated protein
MSDTSSENLSASFTDLMTSLAVIFILLLVAATNATVHQFQQEKGKSTNERDRLIKQLQQVFPGLDVKADLHDPLGVIVVLPEGLLNFVKDKADIPDPGRQYLQTFIPKLARVTCSKTDLVRSVVVEGHTDASGSDEWNIQLSQDRASRVAELTLEILKGDANNYDCFLGMMSASGRGKNDQISVKGQVDEGKSRRVEFHLRVPSFEQRSAVGAASGNSQIELRND